MEIIKQTILYNEGYIASNKLNHKYFYTPFVVLPPVLVITYMAHTWAINCDAERQYSGIWREQ